MGDLRKLPCDIEQVVHLLGIQVVRDTGTQLHCRCPFCADRKAHLNVKLKDNVFRCNRCGKGGGVLHLYAAYCDVPLSTAYEELCRIFIADTEVQQPARMGSPAAGRQIAPTELPLADVSVRDNTYSNLLSVLSLCPSHRELLLARGLSNEQIEWLGYRTTPATRTKRIVTELLERGCCLEGVPGFCCDKETGLWKIDLRGSGIMLPNRNSQGQIEAVQIRRDKVTGGKYYNFTSSESYYGAQSRCCPHCVGITPGDDTVCLTEGILKADVAYFLGRATRCAYGFVGVTGVSQKNQYLRAFSELRQLGVKRIMVMIDADYREKKEVKKWRDFVVQEGAINGFDMVPVSWNPKYKGIDDLYLHMKSRAGNEGSGIPT